MTSDDPTQRTAENLLNPHNCPVCGNPVDPRKTTQALHRNGRLMLFCTSGCLRTFVAEERAAKDKAAQTPTE